MHNQDFLKLDYNQLYKWILLRMTGHKKTGQSQLGPRCELTFTRPCALVFRPIVTYQQAK